MAEKSPRSTALGYLVALSYIGIEMVVPIFVGLFLDRWLGTLPWLMLAGILIGLLGGLAHMMQILKRIERSDSQEPPQPPS